MELSIAKICGALKGVEVQYRDVAVYDIAKRVGEAMVDSFVLGFGAEQSKPSPGAR